MYLNKISYNSTIYKVYLVVGTVRTLHFSDGYFVLLFSPFPALGAARFPRKFCLFALLETSLPLAPASFPPKGGTSESSLALQVGRGGPHRGKKKATNAFPRILTLLVARYTFFLARHPHS